MKIAKTVGAIVGVIVVIGVIFLFRYDFGSYKPQVEAAASKATGRDFRINGELSIRVLPSPTIRMTDATLANAEWADDPSMLEISEMSVKVGLWSLLSGPILIKDLQLHDVVARLESNGAGESNADFDVAEDEPPATTRSSQTVSTLPSVATTSSRSATATRTALATRSPATTTTRRGSTPVPRSHRPWPSYWKTCRLTRSSRSMKVLVATRQTTPTCSVSHRSSIVMATPR